MTLAIASFAASNFQNNLSLPRLWVGAVNCRRLQAGRLLQVSRAHGSSNLVLYYAKGNTVIGMALPDVALLPFPWPINQLKCLRPSWFIFAPASHLIPRLRLLLPRCLLTESGAAAVAGAGASICLKYLTGTCAQQFQLPFVVVWPLPAFYSFCICVCVCVFSVYIYIYIVFFVLLLNSQVAFEAEFPLLRCLLPLSLCFFFAIFQPKRKQKSFFVNFPYNAQ